MSRGIKIFKTLEEQEDYFLEYFYNKTNSERLRALASLQIKNNKEFLTPSPKKITLKKHFLWTSNTQNS
jgi:hypothetical protein